MDDIGVIIKNAVFRQVKSGRVITNSAKEFGVVGKRKRTEVTWREGMNL